MKRSSSALAGSCVTPEKAKNVGQKTGSNNDCMWFISLVTLDKSIFKLLHQPQSWCEDYGVLFYYFIVAGKAHHKYKLC